MNKAAFASAVAVALIVGLAAGLYLPPFVAVPGVGGGSTGEQRYLEVEFTVPGVCSPPVWISAWGVDIGNRTLVIEPSNAPLPLNNTEFMAAPQYGNFSSIVFDLADGTYVYSVTPTFMSQMGTVVVAASDVTVTVHPPPVGCTTTSRATT